jgi:hypothetical protein
LGGSNLYGPMDIGFGGSPTYDMAVSCRLFEGAENTDAETVVYTYCAKDLRKHNFCVRWYGKVHDTFYDSTSD